MNHGRGLWVLGFGAVVAVFPRSSASGGTEPSPRPETAAYQWLVQHQSPTGLLGNQEADAFSGVYSVALAGLCFLHEGDVEKTRKAFEVYDRFREEFFHSGGSGGLPQFWDAATGLPHREKDQWLGDNAWLLIALNHYRARTGDARFDPLRRDIEDWILKLQDTDGGIYSGFNREGPMMSKSTEGNLDAYAALIRHADARERVGEWLWEAMWITAEGRFRMGSTVEEAALDGASWGVAALGSAAAPALAYAENRFGVSATLPTGRNIRGFRDVHGRNRIWYEGTGQMALAYHLAGQRTKALSLLDDLEAAMVPSERFPGARGLPCVSSDPDWTGADSLIFVPSVCWYLFAKWGFNPMQPPGGRLP